MSLVIRDVQEHELVRVLELNNAAAGPSINALDLDRLRRFHADAEYFRVAERNGEIFAFLVAFGFDADHDSDNFCWFQQNIDEPFLYIDRIVVDHAHRGKGTGHVFYADVQTYAEMRYPVLACEVFLVEGFNRALLFHGSLEFQEIGQCPQNERTRAAMLVKTMCSHAWISEHYGKDLPSLPWVGHPRTDWSNQRTQGTGTR